MCSTYFWCGPLYGRSILVHMTVFLYRICKLKQSFKGRVYIWKWLQKSMAVLGIILSTIAVYNVKHFEKQFFSNECGFKESVSETLLLVKGCTIWKHLRKQINGANGSSLYTSLNNHDCRMEENIHPARGSKEMQYV